jgi:hypothetical protein
MCFVVVRMLSLDLTASHLISDAGTHVHLGYMNLEIFTALRI